MPMTLFKKISEMSLIKKISDELGEPLFSGRGLLPLLLIIACLSVNVSVRLFPAYFPEFNEGAVLRVIGRYSAEMSEKYAGNKEEKSRRITEQVQELIGTDPTAFNKKFDLELAKLKDPFQDEHGLTYLMEYDPYTWARWTENVLRNGHPGDKIVKGKSYDSTMLAPLGCEVFYYRFLFYLSAFLYRAVHFFTGVITVHQFLFFIPVFYAVCFLLVMYRFVSSRSTHLSAFLAVSLIGLANDILQRSSAGWYDFDMLSLLMPVLVAGCFLRSLKKDAHLRERIAWACAAAFFEGVYSMTWPGWPVMLLIVGGFLLTAILSRLFERREGSGQPQNVTRNYFTAGGVFFAMSIVFGFLFIGDNFFKQFDWLAKYLKLGTSVHGGGLIWPSVLYTITEMDSLSVVSLAQHFYGPVIFFAALLSIPLVIFKEWRTDRRDVVLLMLCWFCVMGAASLKGQRFVIFLAIPLFFFFSLLLGEYLPDFLRKRSPGLKRIAGFSIYFLLIALLGQTVVKSGIAKAGMIRPVMNDSWHNALVFLDKNSPKDAIVNSWWDYGNWFRYYGNRRVIFDGTSNHPSLVYWMARILLEKDEAKAFRILRMLNNAGYDTWYRLEKQIKDPFQCGVVLEKLLNSDQEEARKILEAQGFSGEDSREILRGLYAKPAPAYFVAERSLFGKMQNISFLGNWDFRKLYARKNRKRPGDLVADELVKIYGLSPAEAEKIVHEDGAKLKTGENDSEPLSRRYSFHTGVVNNAREGELIYFDYGLVFNPRSHDALLYSPEDGKYKVPRKVILFEDGGFSEIKKENADDRRVALLIHQGNTYKSFLADEELVGSLYVRLFFLGGNKSKYFEPFYSDDENGIYIYKINWDAK